MIKTYKILFSDEQFDELSDGEVSKVLKAYEEAVKPCSEVNLRRLLVHDS